jgi:hypothetical protein
MLGGNPNSLSPFPAIADQNASLESCAMAYLHVNSSSCHRPGDIGGGNIDLPGLSGPLGGSGRRAGLWAAG